MEGAICIGTNPDDEQTPLITIGWVLHPISGLNDLFLGPKYGKVLVEKAPSLHTSSSCNFFCRVCLPWIALGSLVVINNDEGDNFQPISVQSTF